MKRLLFILMSAFLLVACGNDDANDEKTKDDTEKTIEIGEEVVFQDFKATIEEATIEDGQITIPIKWLNLAGEGKMFMQVAGLDVEQTGGLLTADDDNEDETRKENASQGEWTIELSYELVNETDPVTITFAPRTEEDSETITVTLQ